jgi:hypothetical protein
MLASTAICRIGSSSGSLKRGIQSGSSWRNSATEQSASRTSSTSCNDKPVSGEVRFATSSYCISPKKERDLMFLKSLCFP